MVRREAAAEVGYLDPDFFVYYDECDFCKRLGDAGWRTLFVPAAEPSTTTSSPPTSPPGCRGSSSSTATATSTCASTTARCRPRGPPAHRLGLRPARPRRHRPPRPARGVYWAHARQALFPERGESIRDRVGRQMRESSSMRSAS